MKYLAIMLMLLINQPGYAQEMLISGKILNLETSEPLPYVSIGITSKGVGTVSDKNGFFKLELSDIIRSNDTVVFSYIGFQTVKIAVSDLKKIKEPVLLEPKAKELSEVVISSKKAKLRPKIIGRNTKGLGLMHYNFYTYHEKSVDDRLSKELGMKFNVRKSCEIKNLNFNITSNDFKSLKFRVNIYKIHNGLPQDLIIEDNIVFEITDRYIGWFKVDLEPYKIYLSEDIEEIAVTIQWLESIKKDEKSKYFAISAAKSPSQTSFFREKAMDNWIKSGQSLSFYLNALCE